MLKIPRSTSVSSFHAESMTDRLAKAAELYTRKLEHGRKEANLLNQELEETNYEMSRAKSNPKSDTQAKLYTLRHKTKIYEDRLANEQSKLNKTQQESKKLKEKIDAMRKERQNYQKFRLISVYELEKVRSATDRMRGTSDIYRSETDRVLQKIGSSKQIFHRTNSIIKSNIVKLESDILRNSEETRSISNIVMPEIRRPKTPLEIYNLNKHFTKKLEENGINKHKELKKFKKMHKEIVKAFNEMKGSDMSIEDVVNVYLN